jgi:Raf kinase inhibitor-like YbhB/YbcL family protein
MTLRRALQAALLLALAATLTSACKQRDAVQQNFPDLQLKSPAFSDGGTIPDQFASCEGLPDDSPILSWQAPPSGTQSFALIVTDPDTHFGAFTHWLLFNIPPDTRELPQAIRKEDPTPNGTRQGLNDFGEIGYDGPCPPGHSTHNYIFNLYALDTRLELPPRVEKKQLLEAMNKHILARGHLPGRYSHR